MKKFLVLALTGIILLSGLSGCGAKEESSQASGENAGDVREITVAVYLGFKPQAYVDEKGEPAGYDLEVLKKVDELLPEYSFKFESVDWEPMLIGIESNKYQIGVAGLFKNSEREKKFLFPEQNLAKSPVVLVLRSDINVDSIEEAAKAGLAFVPVSPSVGTYPLYVEYNETHPDNQVKINTGETFTDAELITGISQGKYDAMITPKVSYEAVINDLKFTNIKIAGEYVTSIPTYALLNKSEQELSDRIDEALLTLVDNGAISALSVEWLGEDVTKL